MQFRNPFRRLPAPLENPTAPQFATRLERRKGLVPPAALDEKGLAAYRLAVFSGRNVPHERTTPRRGKKARRHAAAG